MRKGVCFGLGELIVSSWGHEMRACMVVANYMHHGSYPAVLRYRPLRTRPSAHESDEAGGSWRLMGLVTGLKALLMTAGAYIRPARETITRVRV